MNLEPIVTLERAKRTLITKDYLSKKRWLNLELAYIPHYIFTYSLSTFEFNLLCDPEYGISHIDPDLEEELVYSEKQAIVDKLRFTPVYFENLNNFYLSEAQKAAESFASKNSFLKNLQKTVRKKSLTPQLKGFKLVHWPIWIQHFSASEKYDFRYMDALTGEKNSLRKRTVLMSAFLNN